MSSQRRSIIEQRLIRKSEDFSRSLSHEIRYGAARIDRESSRSGSAMVLLAFLLPVVLAVAAYSINVVYMELVRTELQIATDVTTRAAGRVYAVRRNQAEAIAAAQWLATLNPVGDTSLSVHPEDIVFGVSTRDEANVRYNFSSGRSPNAVRLKTETMAFTSGSGLPMLFPTMGVPVEFRPIKTAICTQLELDVAIVLDRSNSMAFRGDELSGSYRPSSAPFGWTYGWPVPPDARWLDVIASTHRFLDLLNETPHDERVALVTFASDDVLDVKLTNQYELIKFGMKQHSDRFLGGKTDLEKGIKAAADALSDKKLARAWGTRIIVVMSDGLRDAGKDPVAAATNAARDGISVFAISFSNEANQSLMKNIANAGRGTHIHATDSSQLAEAFSDIAASLPTLITH